MFKKQYLKTKSICKVYFKLTKEQTGNAKEVNITGDFNNWNPKTDSMKKLKNGDFSFVMGLEKDRVYQFRYILDNERWINDDCPDGFSPSGYPGVNNSVISL